MQNTVADWGADGGYASLQLAFHTAQGSVAKQSHVEQPMGPSTQTPAAVHATALPSEAQSGSKWMDSAPPGPQSAPPSGPRLMHSSPLSGELENTHSMPAGQGALVQSGQGELVQSGGSCVEPAELDELEAPVEPEVVTTLGPQAPSASNSMTRREAAVVKEGPGGGATMTT